MSVFSILNTFVDFNLNLYKLLILLYIFAIFSTFKITWVTILLMSLLLIFLPYVFKEVFLFVD